MNDVDAYLIDEYIPPDDGQPLAAAAQAAADALAAAIVRAIRAGVSRGRYSVADGIIVLAKERG